MKRSILSDVGNCRSIIIYCTAVFRYVVVICRLFHTEICCVAEGAATFSVGFVNLGDLALNYDFLFLPSDSRNLIIFELLDYVGWVACPLRTNFHGSKSTFQIKSPLMAWWSNFVSNFHQSNITTAKKKNYPFSALNRCTFNFNGPLRMWATTHVCGWCQAEGFCRKLHFHKWIIASAILYTYVKREPNRNSGPWNGVNGKLS